MAAEDDVMAADGIVGFGVALWIPPCTGAEIILLLVPLPVLPCCCGCCVLCCANAALDDGPFKPADRGPPLALAGVGAVK